MSTKEDPAMVAAVSDDYVHELREALAALIDVWPRDGGTECWLESDDPEVVKARALLAKADQYALDCEMADLLGISVGQLKAAQQATKGEHVTRAKVDALAAYLQAGGTQ